MARSDSRVPAQVRTGWGGESPGRVRPPVGLVCILFSDIEKSTALWERYGDAFSEILEVHNQELRTAIEEHGGYEVKTEGDAFMISFVDPRQAMRFAMTVQERLNKAAWPKVLLADLAAGLVAGLESRDGFRGLRVRMGLHVGRPRCQPDPVTGRMDYFGRMVNRAARVEGVARCGSRLRPAGDSHQP